MKSFQDLKIENFFFVKIIDDKRSSVPDIAILKAEIDKGEINWIDNRIEAKNNKVEDRQG